MAKKGKEQIQDKTVENGASGLATVDELKLIDTKLPKLSIKQERFANIVFMNPDMYAHDAYKLAGYHPRTKESAKACASQLLTNPNLKLYLSQLRAAVSIKTGIDGVSVVESFVDVANRAREAKDLANENRALENLGKHLGIFDKDNQQSRQVTFIRIDYGSGS